MILIFLGPNPSLLVVYYVIGCIDRLHDWCIHRPFHLFPSPDIKTFLKVSKFRSQNDYQLAEAFRFVLAISFTSTRLSSVYSWSSNLVMSMIKGYIQLLTVTVSATYGVHGYSIICDFKNFWQKVEKL